MKCRCTPTFAEAFTAEMAAGQQRARRAHAADQRLSRRERFAVGDHVVFDSQRGSTVSGTVEALAGPPGPNQQIVVRYARSGLVGTPELGARWRHATVRGWLRSLLR